MADENMIKKGEVVPDINLKDQNEQEIKISEYKGKKVLLSFHPLAWTPVCAMQMKSLEDNRERFSELNTVPFGISVDSVPSKKAWAQELGVEHTQLLADFWKHGGFAKELGIFLEDRGISKRANIILDENGQVAFVKIYPISEVPDIEEIIETLKSLEKKENEE
jgi:peroxiredoxin